VSNVPRRKKNMAASDNGDAPSATAADAAWNVPGDAAALEAEIAQLATEQAVNRQRAQAAVAALTAMQERARDAESTAARAQPVPASPAESKDGGPPSDGGAHVQASPPQPGTEEWAQHIVKQIQDMTEMLQRHGHAAPGVSTLPG